MFRFNNKGKTAALRKTNLYNQSTPEAQEKRLLEANELKKVIELAKKCLLSTDFQEYTRAYFNTEQKLIDALIGYDNPDPVSYGFTIREILSELKTIRSLLKGVKKDAGESING